MEIEAAFLAARQRGNEGLMAKDPNSIYTPGRRGLAWLKLKKAFVPKLSKVLPGIKVARYLQIENKIRAIVKYEIAGEVPLAQ